MDVNKKSASNQCDICLYKRFLNKKFQPYVCYEYHDLLVMCVKLSCIAILKLKSVD